MILLVINASSKFIWKNITLNISKLATCPEPAVIRYLVTATSIDPLKVTVFRVAQRQKAFICYKIATPDTEILQLIE
jgi:hypothetical protein